MNVFDNVFIYVTDEGEEGIIRADNKEEALERAGDYEGPFVKIKTIINLKDLDNDYGIVKRHLIDEEIKNQTLVHQISFDIIGDATEEELQKAIENSGCGVKVLGSSWKATWRLSGYIKNKPPISSD